MFVGNMEQKEPYILSNILKSYASIAMRKYENKEESYKLSIIDELVIANFDVSYTQLRNERKFEFHKDFWDLHLIIDGEEIIGFSPKIITEESEYIKNFDSEKDLGFLYDGSLDNNNTALLKKGDYAIFSPYEAHQPLVATNSSPIKVKKLVLKVHKSILNCYS